jgi:hypothetical protein
MNQAWSDKTSFKRGKQFPIPFTPNDTFDETVQKHSQPTAAPAGSQARRP